MIYQKLTWGGMGYSVLTWIGPGHERGLDLRLQFREPSRYFTTPDAEGRMWFAEGMWPHQIPATGTVSLDTFAYSGLPPAEAVEELEKLIREEYLDHLAWANDRGIPAEPIPEVLHPVPVFYSMDAGMFVDHTGRPAHAGALSKAE